jgi:hypothetical protein
MDVEQLRKQAKELVRAARAGDEVAAARFEGRELILARAQLVIARENGFSSWPALVHAGVEGFVQAAMAGRRERALQLLTDEITEDPWAALVLGRGWDGNVHTGGGPLERVPLIYATHSCFPSPRSWRRCSSAEPTRTRASRTSSGR